MSEAQQTVADAGAKPAVGEATGKQVQGMGGIAGVYSTVPAFRGYDPAPPGTFETYRRMRGNPTIALARAVATMPIRMSEVGLEAKDGVSDELTQFVQDAVLPLWPRLLRDMLLALDFGFAGFEKVWEVRAGAAPDGGNRLVYRKLKPLLWDTTKIRETDDGSFAGFEQGNIKIGPEKSFLFTYDAEVGLPYGRSRHENARKPWSEWEQATAKEGQYVTKVSGVIPIIQYEPGVAPDATGAMVDKFQLGIRALEHLGRGAGILVPKELAKYAQDLIRQGVDITKLMAWDISFLEAKGQHGAELTGILRHKESLMLRGWLVPERAASEGQLGTKAEAETHVDLAAAMSDLVLDDIIAAVNQYVIDPLLVYNVGPDARGSVHLSTSGTSPEQTAFVRTIIQGVLTQPGNVDLFLRLIDYDALLDQVGLPKGSEIADAGDFTPPAASPEAQGGASDGNPQMALRRQAEQIIRSIHRGRDGSRS